MSDRPDIVPEDWILVLCEAGCGDMVWVPPDLPEEAIKVCTSACAMKVAKEVIDEPRHS